MPVDYRAHLCVHDPRSDVYIADEDDPPPRNGCHCDRCFYGRDALALQLMDAESVLEKIRDTDYRGNRSYASVLAFNYFNRKV